MDETEYRRRLRDIRAQIPASALAALYEAHEAYGFSCSAWGEGLACCVDWLIADEYKDA